MKEKIAIIVEQIKSGYKKYIVETYKAIIKTANSSDKDRRRVLIIALSLLLVTDYLMFCLHIEKNIFDIFPSIPLLDEKRTVTVYLPTIEGNSFLEEKIDIPIFDTSEEIAKYLFDKVKSGSQKENTRMIVPNQINVREIWMAKNELSTGSNTYTCIIDVDSNILLEKSIVIKGSEENFRKALSKTIISVIPTVKSVVLLEKGIPDKQLWEL